MRRWDEWQWLPGPESRCACSKADRVVVVSNQAGIARGMMSDESLRRIHDRMCEEAVEAAGRIDRVYHCPHGWDDGCDCRNPGRGCCIRRNAT